MAFANWVRSLVTFGRILVLLLAVTAAKYGVSAGTGNSAGAEAGSHAAQRRGQCGHVRLMFLMFLT